MKHVFAALLLILLGLSVACGGGAETPLPPTLAVDAAPTRRPVIVPTTPAGWTPYSRSTFQIALPDTWQEIKLTDADLQSAMQAAQESNPQLADQLGALRSSGQFKALTFYGIDQNNATSLRNVSIARVALEGTNDLETFANAYAKALPNVIRGSKLVEMRTPARINGINAAMIVYDVSLVDSSGDLATLRGVQYLYMLDSGDTYLVTVTGAANDADAFMKLAQQIGTSFVGVSQ